MLIIIIIIALYFIWCVIAYLFQGQMVFPRRYANQWQRVSVPDHIEALWLDHPDSIRTEAWFRPGEGISSDRPGPLVIYAHGNGELIDNNIELSDFLHSQSISILLIEYRGYGRSQGTPSEQVIVRDAHRWIEQMKLRQDVDARQLIYWGRSIGAGVMCQLALEESPAGLILQTALLRCDTFAWRFGFPPFLMRHPFRTDLALPDIFCPLLILQHTTDQIAPITDGRMMKQLAAGPATLIELDGTHNALASQAEQERQERAIRQFLKLIQSNISY